MTRAFLEKRGERLVDEGKGPLPRREEEEGPRQCIIMKAPHGKYMMWSG